MSEKIIGFQNENENENDTSEFKLTNHVFASTEPIPDHVSNGGVNQEICKLFLTRAYRHKLFKDKHFIKYYDSALLNGRNQTILETMFFVPSQTLDIISFEMTGDISECSKIINNIITNLDNILSTNIPKELRMYMNYKSANQSEQSGGHNLKYQKYKTKYLELKNKLNN